MPDGTTKQCFVAYALGNFTADQRAINTRDSIILNLKVTKKANGQVLIDNVDYIPLYIYKDPSLTLKKFKLIDLNKAITDYENGTNTSIGSTAYNLFKTELKQIKNIVEK